MSENHGADQSLRTIYSRAINLAADRLSAMSGSETEEDFDRGARSARTLVITAMQVNALKSQIEKDVAADAVSNAAETDLAMPSDEELDQFRCEVMARLERNRRPEDRQADGERCAEKDESESSAL